jgi:tRNA dimethylallyltransferase
MTDTPPQQTSSHSLPTLVAIMGPTASGKSALAVWLARQLGGEVLACDSTQLYRGFDVGTAKPTIAERCGVPHHLIDVLSPNEIATAGRYRELAVAALQDLRLRKRLPVFTVGTGLYLRALLDGLADLPQRSESLRDRLRTTTASHPPGYLHRVLRRLDPEASRKIAATDEQKLIRAIEICLLTRQPLSQVHQSGRRPLEGWHPVKIGLAPPREQLYQRIHARTDAMLAHGWLEEVRALIGGGLPEIAKPFEFIGYRELLAVLRQTMPLDDARIAIQQATRRYAKRQLTWFRKETGVQWFEGFGNEPGIHELALQWLRSQDRDTTRPPTAGTGV